jgi:hypothetical protein
VSSCPIEHLIMDVRPGHQCPRICIDKAPPHGWGSGPLGLLNARFVQRLEKNCRAARSGEKTTNWLTDNRENWGRASRWRGHEKERSRFRGAEPSFDGTFCIEQFVIPWSPGEIRWTQGRLASESYRRPGGFQHDRNVPSSDIQNGCYVRSRAGPGGGEPVSRAGNRQRVGLKRSESIIWGEELLRVPRRHIDDGERPFTIDENHSHPVRGPGKTAARAQCPLCRRSLGGRIGIQGTHGLVRAEFDRKTVTGRGP